VVLAVQVVIRLLVRVTRVASMEAIRRLVVITMVVIASNSSVVDGVAIMDIKGVAGINAVVVRSSG
jgi:hypothetical protein